MQAVQEGVPIRRIPVPEICDAIRDLFGNPFRPIVAELRWCSPAAVALAAGIYQDYAFERLPQLAEALVEAGCNKEAILGHCFGEHRHYRGCWVVDMVLGDWYWASRERRK